MKQFNGARPLKENEFIKNGDRLVWTGPSDPGDSIHNNRTFETGLVIGKDGRHSSCIGREADYWGCHAWWPYRKSDAGAVSTIRLFSDSYKQEPLPLP